MSLPINGYRLRKSLPTFVLPVDNLMTLKHLKTHLLAVIYPSQLEPQIRLVFWIPTLQLPQT